MLYKQLNVNSIIAKPLKKIKTLVGIGFGAICSMLPKPISGICTGV